MTDPAAADHSATPASDEVHYMVSDAVATLTIDRPARRNALSWDVVRRLRAYLAEAQRDPEVRVVVLTGAGDVAFCSPAYSFGCGGHPCCILH